MSMEAHFKKLLAYEHELIQQSHAKDIEKKRKAIALKASFSKEDHTNDSSDDEDVENLNLIVKKFGKFLKRSKDIKLSKTLKKVETNNTFICFECKGTSSRIVCLPQKTYCCKEEEHFTQEQKKKTDFKI